MSLLLSMLPVYLLGNLHCLGMCGPIAMLIGRHRYRHFYFIGRLISFSLVGWLAGSLGAVLHFFLRQYHIGAAVSLGFGLFIILLGVYQLKGSALPGQQWLAQKSSGFNQQLALLMLKDAPYPSFLLGFFTVILPCGQSLLVFSACALAADAFTGWLNGLAFALLTSPSLLLAMHAQHYIKSLRNQYHTIMSSLALFVGLLAVARGLAELGWIPHLVLNSKYHIVLY